MVALIRRIYTPIFSYPKFHQEAVMFLLFIFLAIFVCLGIQQKCEAITWLFFVGIFCYLAFHHWELSELSKEASKLWKSEADQTYILNLASEPSHSNIELKFSDLNSALVVGYLFAAGTVFFLSSLA